MAFDLDACIASLLQKQLLGEALLREICEKTKELLMRESNVVHIASPVTVVGDIHGQFYDLIEIFRIGGYSPHTNYLFLGDYVDRGLFSVETISLLTCLKLRYPDRVQLIRGNHESRAVTQTYGFYTECTRKYGNANVWTYFTDMFDFLTLSTVIDDQIFCVHGGLSPSVHFIDQIKIIDRFREIPHEGPMADLVWSDPDPDKEEFAISPRGAGFTFGSSVVKHFLARNNMSHILRAHQLCMEGFSVLYDNRLSTVWSAPNYCYRCGNMASILEVGPGGTKHFNTFEAAPENERDGPAQASQAAQAIQAAQANGEQVKVRARTHSATIKLTRFPLILFLVTTGRIFLVEYDDNTYPAFCNDLYEARTKRRANASILYHHQDESSTFHDLITINWKYWRRSRQALNSRLHCLDMQYPVLMYVFLDSTLMKCSIE